MEVLACPFCDGKADIVGSEDTWFVYCDCCGACGSIRATDKEAIESWNRVYVTVSYGKIFRGAMYAISGELDRIATELGEEEEDK